ncbi:MAG: HEPN domain-containing protein [Bacteroidaceae bacterium]|nr:HEPN domain-containing protein [Bacteroidaceae bacterium]
MSLNENERRIMVAHECQKARQTFAQTESLRRDGFWDGVANRLYYASYHAINALLIRDGYSVRTHHGTSVTFRQLYIKTGILPVCVSEHYSVLQTMREKADYNCSFDATQKLIEPLIEPTKQLIDTILDFIENQK